MDSGGRFIVTWVDQAGSQSNVFMREYKADGTPLTGKTQVTTSGADGAPDVAASANSFVITFEHHTNGTIQAERFTYSNGLPVGQGLFTLAGFGGTDTELKPSVAMTPNGTFDVAYEHHSSMSNDVWMDRYDSNATFLGMSHITNYGYAPSVAVDSFGNAVVAHEVPTGGGDFPSGEVLANRVTSTGTVGSAITILNQQGLEYGFNPSVALAPNGGPFVVASNVDAGAHFQATEISASNTVMVANGGYSGTGPAVSIDGYGRYLTSYARYNAASGHSDVFSRRALLPPYSGLDARVSSQLHDNDQSDNASSSNGTSVVVWRNAYSSTDHDIYAQRFDVNGNPAGAAIQVDYTGADSSSPHVAMDSGGRFIVTWVDQVGSQSNVFMREYNADGTPLTGKLAVTTSGADGAPDVAASANSFVITFVHNKTATDSDVQAERFTYTNGLPVGQGLFTLPGFTTSVEYMPSVAMAPSGAYDVAYVHYVGGSNYDIWMDRYDGNGNFQGLSYVNTDTNLEASPSVSMDNAGNAVVAYTELIGSSYGIFANRVSSAGAVGSRILIRSSAGQNFTSPSVALAPVGGLFVVGYQAPSGGVQVQEISSSNTSLETTFCPVPSSGVAVSIDGYGRYLVTYTRPNSGQNDIFSQREFLSA
jgi:hypothetical protein